MLLVRKITYRKMLTEINHPWHRIPLRRHMHLTSCQESSQLWILLTS